MNRIESAMKLQELEIENLSFAKSLIKDADIASETSSFVGSQIMQQVSGSLLTQANNMNGNLVQQLLFG